MSPAFNGDCFHKVTTLMNTLQLRPYQESSIESLRDGFRANHTQTKNCTKCGTEKPISAFGKRSASKDGMQSQCKQCTAAWQKANPEKVNQASAKWRASDPDGTKAYHKQYREANKSAYSEANARWRLKNVEYDKARTAKWHAENPESARLSGQNRRANKARSFGRLSKGLEARLFASQKGKCPCCKKPLGYDYHLDHVMPLALGGSNTDDNMQLLRKTCNLQKNAKHPVEFMQSRGFLL